MHVPWLFPNILIFLSTVYEGTKDRIAFVIKHKRRSSSQVIRHSAVPQCSVDGLTNGAVRNTEIDATVKDTQKSSGHNKADPGGNCQLTTAHTRSSEEVVGSGGGGVEEMEKRPHANNRNKGVSNVNQGLLTQASLIGGRDKRCVE